MVEGGVVEGAFEGEFVEEDADAAEDGVTVSDDVVAYGEDEIATAGGEVTSKRVQLQIILLRKRQYLIADDLTLHGQPTW